MSQEESFSNEADDSARENTEDLRTTTRADLAEALHRKTGFGRTEAAKYVEMVLDEIFDSIVARKDVKLSSFGAFQIRAKKERQGRNPKTGQDAVITARLVVTFKPSNVLRARINKGTEADGHDSSWGDGHDHDDTSARVKPKDGQL
jgi:integration host factor subunit alpha